MATKGQLTGMRGVYLVAAELSKLEFIVSLTSRSSFGADIFVTDMDCKKTYSVQVKTNTRIFGFWLLNKHCKELKSDGHLYIFVNLRKQETEYFVVPSKVVSRKMEIGGKWYSFSYENAKQYKNMWSLFKS